MRSFVDYYGLLGIGPHASEEEVREAYRRESFRWHPDRNLDRVAEAHAKFVQIGEAGQVLGSEDSRRRYDLVWKEKCAPRAPSRPRPGRSTFDDVVRDVEAARMRRGTPRSANASQGHSAHEEFRRQRRRLRFWALTCFWLASIPWTFAVELLISGGGGPGLRFLWIGPVVFLLRATVTRKFSPGIE